MRSFRRDCATGKRKDETGFTILELVIASTIMAVAMMSLSYSLAGSMKVQAWSEQRQTASALAGQVLEKVRALDFTTVADGMSTANIVAVQNSGQPDPNIVGSSAPYTFEPAGGCAGVCEQIISGSPSSNPPAPLYPYMTGPQQINGTSYTTATYVTQPSSQICVGCYRVTVLVTWTPSQVTQSGANQVSVDTLLSPTTGCLSSTTHPLAAPCQPFFYGTASADAGSIAITPATPGTPGISDLLGGTIQLQDAQLGLFEDDATFQNEQVSEVSGNARTNQVSIQTVAGNVVTGGGITGTANADNDPAIDTNMTGPTYINQSGTVNVAQSTAGGNSLTLGASNADSASLVSTTAAHLSTACDDLSALPGLPQNTSGACGSESVTQNGSGSGATQLANATMSATLGLPSPGLGSVNLASIAPVAGYTPTRSFVAYYPAGDGTLAACTQSSGDGCVHAGAAESIGTIALGGLPSLGLPLPPGWSGSLVEVTNYSASVSTESGVGVTGSSTPAPPSASCSFTISWWNGSGYSATPCSSGGTTIAPSATLSALVGGALVSINISATFQTGAAATTTGSGTESAEVSPPLSGNMTYTISVGGVDIVDLNIAVNLGTLIAETDYQAAPSAS